MLVGGAMLRYKAGYKWVDTGVCALKFSISQVPSHLGQTRCRAPITGFRPRRYS